jgi:hypothetical protein
MDWDAFSEDYLRIALGMELGAVHDLLRNIADNSDIRPAPGIKPLPPGNRGRDLPSDGDPGNLLVG